MECRVTLEAPKYVLQQGLEGDPDPAILLFFFTTSFHLELLLSLSPIPFSFPIPHPVPRFWQIPLSEKAKRSNPESRQDILRLPESRTVDPRKVRRFNLNLFKVDRLQIIVVAKKYIYVSQLFISRMPKILAIPQLVSAPLNPIPIAEHFRRSHPPCEPWCEHSRGQHVSYLARGSHGHSSKSLRCSICAKTPNTNYQLPKQPFLIKLYIPPISSFGYVVNLSLNNLLKRVHFRPAMEFLSIKTCNGVNFIVLVLMLSQSEFPNERP